MKTQLTTDIETIIRVNAFMPNKTGDVTIGQANRAIVNTVRMVMDRLDLKSFARALVADPELKRALNIHENNNSRQ